MKLRETLGTPLYYFTILIVIVNVIIIIYGIVSH